MIRPAKVTDIKQIVELIQPYIKDFALNAEGEAKFSQDMIEKLLEMQSIEYFVLEKDLSIIGVIAYKQPSHLIHFFVKQDSQQQGIGRQLWMFLEDKLSQQHSKITVNSSCYAQSVYENFGFIVTSTVIENGGLRYIPMCKSYA
ncbi:GNAT family N-acetyltransferase [Acinetobacter sp. WCHA45]|uniref:GNAT family N-acetyltransferase n=1 Tax=Acinetobacter sp. WCHA45 TaxID=2004644 RepID=UPI000B3D4FB3|nr:GNAT family N-acetyltransferase [Acinetobacter sp. WCHA45]AVZ86473.1 GNAT family N-acetyltransferase [Acinetobacter sp. WCHA45]